VREVTSSRGAEAALSIVRAKLQHKALYKKVLLRGRTELLKTHNLTFRRGGSITPFRFVYHTILKIKFNFRVGRCFLQRLLTLHSRVEPCTRAEPRHLHHNSCMTCTQAWLFIESGNVARH
jgi:hypothetical protein